MRAKTYTLLYGYGAPREVHTIIGGLTKPQAIAYFRRFVKSTAEYRKVDTLWASLDEDFVLSVGKRQGIVIKRLLQDFGEKA